MNTISIKNLTINYDDLIVLKNFNADFSTGVHWVQGHNGSGKSSLLKSLCGINPIAPNCVNIMGHDLVKEHLKAKSLLCYVPDKPDVYPFMTGIQFLKMVAKIKSVKLSKDLYHWLDAINLTQFNHIEFSQMSFGTRRKFALSTVFIGNPQVILLDEPFNGLDKNTIKQFLSWIQQIKKQKTLLVVSHDTLLLKDLQDSVLLLQ